LLDKFDELSSEEQKKLLDEAEKKLKELEDLINEVVTKPLGEDQRTHSHKKQAEDKAEEDRKDKEQKRQQAQEEAFKQAVLKSLTPYGQLYREVSAEVDKSFRILRRIFVPSEDYTWNEGHPSGSKLNLQEAMQFEADPLRYSRLFERRLTPTKASYSFVLLGDCSPSMDLPYHDPTIKHLQRAMVFLTELLSRLNVEHRIDAFNDGVKEVKNWKDRISDPKIQQEVAETLNTGGRTTRDALAIKSGYAELQHREERHRYIIIISDGDSQEPENLRSILEKIKEDGEVTVVHFGVGDGTADIYGFYEHSFGNLPITASDPERTFFSVFCKVITAMILTPEKFGRQK
ncbi:MAG: VWA domain-containing protein, partial [Bdellovibrionales bacterium]|nr:VWA domain-containing protein [Bdellovibrionales bacterium]